MALSAPIDVTPVGIPSLVEKFFVDRRRPCKIIHVTKLSGDTSGTVDTKLQYVKRIILLKADGTLDATGTATVGFGAAGATFTTTLASLTTGGTELYVIAIGGRN
jgi:hypothetical protein